MEASENNQQKSVSATHRINLSQLRLAPSKDQGLCRRCGREDLDSAADCTVHGVPYANSRLLRAVSF